MSGYVNVSGNYDFGELGIIHVNVRSTARSIKARWKAGAIVVSAPTGIPYDRLKETIRGFAPQLEQIRPEPVYTLGQSMQLGEVKVEIRSQRHLPDRILAQVTDDSSLLIEIGEEWDISSPGTIKVINKYIRRLAQIKAPGILIPRARVLADEVDASPMAWEISNGARVLGHCNQKGVIALSYLLILYPPHLIDFVIYHELAHLTEMNHSPRFHEICDRYCKGRERQWRDELKSMRIPLSQ